MIGSSIGHFEITAKVGEGGMGEVYRATDTKLRREVAVKVLPEGLAGDEQRMSRFEREAQLLAALSHPNIASIFGVEESAGTKALVMEMVEGENLSDRLQRSSLSIEETAKIAFQIAAALESAHEKGVVHRDLKPANVKVTPDGTVKVLDFGLAKAMEPEKSDSSPDLTQSPTLSLAATQAGLILGTAGYMSPEQASGQATDQRADIWAFGVVLYEMLSGQPLFQGETASHTMADVLRADIDWSRLPADLPHELRRLVERCLDRKPEHRLRDIGEARVV
ncbi:MAG: serine/threonine-protein kinase, partial [Thermoanaerobaculia bacterium]|nr:serine/threonine-protein kinase [Thermoanaerobaculia bacterium]